MKNMKKSLVVFGTIAIALMVMSTVTAVPELQSEPVIEYVENQEQYEIDSQAQSNLKTILQNFYMSYFASEEFCDFINDEQTQELVSDLWEMAPTLVSYLNIGLNNANLMIYLTETSVENQVISNTNLGTSNEMNVFVSEVLNIFDNTMVTSVVTEPLNMGLEEVLNEQTSELTIDGEQATILDYGNYLTGDLRAIYYELKTTHQSPQFIELKNTISSHSLVVQLGQILDLNDLEALIGLLVYASAVIILIIDFWIEWGGAITYIPAYACAVAWSILFALAIVVLISPLLLPEAYFASMQFCSECIQAVFGVDSWEDLWTIFGILAPLILICVIGFCLLASIFVAIAMIGQYLPEIAQWIIYEWDYMYREFYGMGHPPNIP